MRYGVQYSALPKQDMATNVIPVLTSWRHKDQLKVILSYKVSCRIA